MTAVEKVQKSGNALSGIQAQSKRRRPRPREAETFKSIFTRELRKEKN